MNYIIKKIKPFGLLIQAQSNAESIQSIDIEKLKKYFNEEHLIVLRGFKTFNSSDEFANYCDQFGEVSIWPFGKVLELIQQKNPADHIFDNSYIPMHWDGMYRSHVPEYQIFHCVKAPKKGHGGRTIFSNTIKLLKEEGSTISEKLEGIKGTYYRKMEFYNSKVISPLITKHPYKSVSVIRYNEPHHPKKGKLINIPKLEFNGVSDQEKFQSELEDLLYSPQYSYAHTWEDGDLVIADNFSLLHAREAFKENSARHIQRVQVLSDPPFENPNLETYQ